MSGHFDDFINAGFSEQDRKSFASRAFAAALEISREENGEIIRTSYDRKPEHQPAGWLPTNLSAGGKTKTEFQQAITKWRESGKAILFRGTNLPDAKMGSFQFPDNGVHMTLDFSIALGYAGRINPERHQLLSLENNKGRLGFLSVWEVPLDTKLWGNFHYEDYLKGSMPESNVTIADALNKFEEIANRPVSDHETWTDGANSYHSPVCMEVAELFKYKYYEAVAGNEAKQSEIYLNSPSGMIKIDPENPKWDKWMARVQEASLRDVYEITPLLRTEDVMQSLVRMSQRSEYAEFQQRGALAQEYLDSKLLEIVRSQMESRSWQYSSMSEIGQAEMPWLKSSTRVASSNSSNLVYPPSVNNFVCDTGLFAEMDSFLQTWLRAIEINKPLQQEREKLMERREKSFVGKLQVQKESDGGQISIGSTRTEPSKKNTWVESI